MSKYLVFCDANVNNDTEVWRVDVNNHVRRISDGTFNPTVGNENVPNLPAMAAVTTAAGVPGVLVYEQDIQTQLVNPFFLDGAGTGTVGMGVSELSNVNGSYPGNGLIPQCLMSYDGAVYFNGQVATGNIVEIPTDLWSSDGTVAGTTRITSSDNNPLYPLYMTEAFGNLFFNGFSDGINSLYSLGIRDRQFKFQIQRRSSEISIPIVSPAREWALRQFCSTLRWCSSMVKLSGKSCRRLLCRLAFSWAGAATTAGWGSTYAIALPLSH